VRAFEIDPFIGKSATVTTFAGRELTGVLLWSDYMTGDVSVSVPSESPAPDNQIFVAAADIASIRPVPG
jgi:hypothetical protein